MPLKSVLNTSGSHAEAIKELQGLTQVVVTGDAAQTDIPVPGIKMTDTVVGVVNLTDLSNLTLAGAKASWVGVGGYDAELERSVIGADGDNYKVTLIGDSPAEAGVSVVVYVALKELIVHYESGVSTVGDVNAAIGALATFKDIIDVKDPGTIATVLTAPDDDVTEAALSGGIDAMTNELPAITSAGNVQFRHSDTSAKKLLITYYSCPEE